MNSFLVALVTFVCTFGCAWSCMVIRSKLPLSHQDRESQDVVRLGMGLVATMAAVLLGLVIASAKGSYDEQNAAVRRSAANILALDRLLAQYGPEASKARATLRQALAERIEMIWPSRGAAPSRPGGLEPALGGEATEAQILQLEPTSDSQRWLRTQSLSLDEEVLQARWRLLTTSQEAVPGVFLLIVISWLTVVFASFGLFAPRNGTVIIVFFISALCVAAAIFLILELERPFGGMIKVSSAPLRYALENLGK
jgi:hypothetical protein